MYHLSLTRISHKILKNSDGLSCDLHHEWLSTYRLDYGLKPILNESRTTSRSTFSRFYQKCGLSDTRGIFLEYGQVSALKNFNFQLEPVPNHPIEDFEQLLRANVASN